MVTECGTAISVDLKFVLAPRILLREEDRDIERNKRVRKLSLKGTESEHETRTQLNIPYSSITLVRQLEMTINFVS